MTLSERVINNLNERRQRLIRGEINSIPSPFTKFRSEFIGVEQGKYYLVTSSTKCSKTQFTSFLFVYNSLMYAYQHPDKLSVKIFYFPLEETPENILLRFISHLLYEISDIRIAPTDLKSTDNSKPVDQNILNILEEEPYKNILDFFEKNVIFSSSTNPTGIYQECKQYAEKNGVIHTKKVQIKDDFGNIKDVDKFDYYEANNPNEYKLIIVDHVSLVSSEKGLTLKQSVDKLSEYCVLLRNRYKFSPVLIQQQAFAGESLDAFKQDKLQPSIGNLSDSKYPSRDAELTLGIFSPFKYNKPLWNGYDISKFKDNIRFVEILTNREGQQGGTVALYFDGATCNFEELPAPNNIPEIKKVYDKLDKNNRSKVVMMCIKLLNKINNKYDRITNGKKYSYKL